MNRVLIKVCGITRAKDVKLACRLGADMIGMIFYKKSPRFVSRQLARELVPNIPPTVRSVGVFVDAPIDEVLTAARRLRLDMIQLHGEETDSYIRQLQRHGMKVIKAFSIEKTSSFSRMLTSSADLVMADNKTDKQAGGTGATFNWNLRPPHKIPNLMIAGGLDHKNVKRAIEIYRPAVIDVNSSVEIRPGLKSETRLRRFFESCRSIKYDSP